MSFEVAVNYVACRYCFEDTKVFHPRRAKSRSGIQIKFNPASRSVMSRKRTINKSSGWNYDEMRNGLSVLATALFVMPRFCDKTE